MVSGRKGQATPGPSGSSSRSDAKEKTQSSQEAEKSDSIRSKNNEHVKRSRERKRAQEDHMQKMYVENGKRIQYLEGMVQSLSEELENAPVSLGKKKKSQNHRRRPTSSSGQEQRPTWFGDPF